MPSRLIWQATLPLLALLLITPWSAELDRWMSHLFYQQGHFHQNDYWDWWFHYGLWPAWGVAGFGVVGWLFSFFWPTYRKWRVYFVFLFLTLGVGSGVIVHGLFKEHWGRPRPKQTIEFGGQQPFRPYYSPNFFHSPEPSKSFPCGHCSMGFYFFGLIFLGRHLGWSWLVYLGWLLGIGLGGMLSLTRLAQGGHFFSDTIVSAIVMWETALLFYWLFFDRKKITV